MAQRLRAEIPEHYFLARFGGDEFVIVIPKMINSEEAKNAAIDVLTKLQESLLINERELHISASIGISVYPDHATSRDDLLRCADISMYSSKNAQSNSYRIFQKDMAWYGTRLRLEQRLRAAMIEKPFEIHYQPKFGVEDKNLAGFEALLRWTDSELGVVAPNDFIPVAEELGLIHSLTEIVFSQVCADVNRWSELGFKTVPIAINVSPTTLLLPTFTARVADVLDGSVMTWSDLEIEITEEVFLRRGTDIVDLITSLRDKGVRFALDDFGTRYSSLAYLTNFPIDSLKIDGTFIEGIDEEGSRNRNIVAALIDLAHGLGLEVTAEYVETQAQREFLSSKGCDLMQGYLMYPALPASQCDELLDKGQL